MTVKLSIDGKPVSVAEGTTLMEAARKIDVDTPVICYHEATTSEGLCRQCVVEVDGWRVLAPACVTPVSQDMHVHTDSERVQHARRTILEMLNATVDLSQAPDLQIQMDDYQADRQRFPNAQVRDAQVLDDNPFYVRDYEKCVMCWRCVQACGDDLQFTYSLSTGGRGYESKISTFFDAPMPETTCVFCGNCVAVCPSNALVSKTEFFMDQGLNYDQIRQEKRKQRKQMPRK
ncbi:MAG: Fe-S-binding domain-containing protein [Chloroflexi bacterium]|nr:MAG: Fe-S-binding domain-containing protein [Chloroflexota bacterium]MBL1194136.1 Fe-S-binding domain-containing protein [Chloroflexota bacterium]NOH11429.1 2Fe-2S iron-sulfur cluster binding domain-containing protein [Chloroflexota bacterium]